MDNYQPLRRDTLSDAVSCRIQFVTPEYFDVYRIGSAISGNPEELKEGDRRYEGYYNPGCGRGFFRRKV